MIGTLARLITLLTTVGLPRKPSIAGSGGPVTHLAALTLQALKERGLLTTDIGTGGLAYLDMEVLTAALYIITKITLSDCQFYRAIHRLDRLRILGTEVDITPGRTHGHTGNNHALDSTRRDHSP